MSRCHWWPGHASCGPCPPLCVLMSESDADVRCPGSNCALAACTGDTEPGSHSPLAPAARAVTRTVGDPQMSQHTMCAQAVSSPLKQNALISQLFTFSQICQWWWENASGSAIVPGPGPSAAAGVYSDSALAARARLGSAERHNNTERAVRSSNLLAEGDRSEEFTGQMQLSAQLGQSSAPQTPIIPGENLEKIGCHLFSACGGLSGLSLQMTSIGLIITVCLVSVFRLCWENYSVLLSETQIWFAFIIWCNNFH